MFIHTKALAGIQIKVCPCCFVEVTGAKNYYCLKRKHSTFDQLALIESCFPTEYKQQRVWSPGSFMLTWWLVLCHFMQDMFLVSFPASKVLKYAPCVAAEQRVDKHIVVWKGRDYSLAPSFGAVVLKGFEECSSWPGRWWLGSKPVRRWTVTRKQSPNIPTTCCLLFFSEGLLEFVYYILWTRM